MEHTVHKNAMYGFIDHFDKVNFKLPFVLDCNKNFIKGNFVNSIQLLKKYKSDINKKPIKKSLEKVFILSQRWDHNFRHFHVETLQNIFYFMEYFADLKLLIKVNPSKHLINIIELFNLQSKLIYHDVSEIVQYNEIVIARNKNRKYPAVSNSKYCDLINRCKKLIQVKPISNILLSRERVYNLIKKGINHHSRCIVNWEEVKPLLNNFTPIICENMLLPEQIVQINAAKIVIVEIGAGCENIIFCNSEAHFIILCSKYTIGWAKIYEKYAEIVGCKLTILNIGDPIETTEERIQAKYKINIQKLKTYLSSMLLSSHV